jgi:hypothetical protein
VVSYFDCYLAIYAAVQLAMQEELKLATGNMKMNL